MCKNAVILNVHSNSIIVNLDLTKTTVLTNKNNGNVWINVKIPCRNLGCNDENSDITNKSATRLSILIYFHKILI